MEMKVGFEFDGLRIFAEDKPCIIVFQSEDRVHDIIPFGDVQDASEYLSKCGYYKDKRRPAVWKREKNEHAMVLYMEECDEAER